MKGAVLITGGTGKIGSRLVEHFHEQGRVVVFTSRSDENIAKYKNIDYILRHRGQQRVTNILVDNLLNNVGLDIRSKTIVLDTTSVLDESDRTTTNNITSQCKTCTKRAWCHKNITDRQCDDKP